LSDVTVNTIFAFGEEQPLPAPEAQVPDI